MSIGSNRSSVTDNERMRSTANVRICWYSGTWATTYSPPWAKTSRYGSIT
jgi:hypothetical protein